MFYQATKQPKIKTKMDTATKTVSTMSQTRAEVQPAAQPEQQLACCCIEVRTAAIDSYLLNNLYTL